MTLIVGALCQDGIVLGADSAATATSPGGNTIQQNTAKKLYCLESNLVLGVSGPVGLGQSFARTLEGKIVTSNRSGTTNRNYPWNTVQSAKDGIRKALWDCTQPIQSQSQSVNAVFGRPINSAGIASTLVALPVGDTPMLLNFDEACAPEEVTAQLPFAAVGSGQVSADHFLAFIRRVLFNQAQPNLIDGTLAVVWTLDQAIQAAPGGVGGPIQIVTICKDNAGQWMAVEMDSDTLQGHLGAIESMEQNMGESFSKIFTQPTPAPAEVIPPAPESGTP